MSHPDETLRRHEPGRRELGRHEPGRHETSRRRFRLPRSLRDLVGRELDEEVRAHLELRAEELEARGLSPEEARREARRRFGSVAELRREARDRERVLRAREWLGDVGRDLRFALRGLRRSPVFAAASILTLALGLGATTAIYSVVHPVLFEALPYPEPERVALVFERDLAGERSRIGFTTYLDIAERSRSFSAVAALSDWYTILTGDGPAERLEGQRVSWPFFRALGVAPAVGRDFEEEDDRRGAPPVVILADSLWRARFGGDPDLVGRTIDLDGTPTTVIGVLPAGFESLLGPSARIWRPLRYEPSLPWACRTCRHLQAVARLAPEASLLSADREMRGLAATLFAEHPTEYPDTVGQGMEVVRLRDELTREVRPALLAVLGAVALVLLVACANVSHLLIARAARRHGELAVRAALGESRGRVVRSFVVESLVLAAFGGFLGVGLAFLGVELLVGMSPPGVPRIENAAVDGTMLGFALALTTFVGLAFGLLPAARITRRRLWRRIAGAASSRATSGAPRGQRSALVVAEVALTLILLVGAGLLFKTLGHLLAAPTGFEPEGVLTVKVEAAGARYETEADVRSFFDRLLAEARALPGVEAASLTSQLPLSGEFDSYGVHFRSRPRANPEEDPSAHRYAVSSDYLEAMGIRLLRGRGFEPSDFAVPAQGGEGGAEGAGAAGGGASGGAEGGSGTAGGDEAEPSSEGRPLVVMINQSLARRELGGTDPIGEQIQVGGAGAETPWRTIVGVVADTRQVSLDAESDALYIPETQWPWPDSSRTLVVRAAGGGGAPAALAALVPAIRERVRALDPDAPITRVATLEELAVTTTARTRFALLLFGLFAAVSVVLAAVGIFGVLAGVVAEREREIGVRTALGASRGEIVRMIVRQGLRLSAAGAGLGLVVSVGCSRFLESLLFGVAPLDPATYAGVTALLVAVALTASWAPARRAARLDPAGALRRE
jgi:putative ABC transport system permease protein